MTRLGTPRLHLRETDSTNLRARDLALQGAPHGTLVTAAAQTAGRGRQGRVWTAPPGRALLLSLLLRDPPPLLPLIAAVAVADAVADAGDVAIKWPNDVWLGGRKVAGILVEGRPQEGWAIVGIGVNVAVRAEDLPAELRDRATGLGREPDAIEAVLRALLRAFEDRLAEEPADTLAAWRERDALLGRELRWDGGSGTGAGIDEAGRLLVTTADGEERALNAGEVHLGAV